MSFFGLTALGPQDPIAACKLDALDITLFKEHEFDRAFDRFQTDSSKLEYSQIEPLLKHLYHGPPPTSEVRRLQEAFSDYQESVIPKDAFMEKIRSLQEHLEEKAREKSVGGGDRMSTRLSLSELSDARRRHIRDFQGPKDVWHHPLTLGQDYGWTADEQGTTHEIYPKRKCAETKFAEKMVATGEYFI
eukprot:gb/GECG01007206.1/.p1 GENE.gb/GECG01007206.1/~~gb/GECG01007206.1/.p1  ORF type:complete len:189 (+),score=21.59 gb/GECG01007206.1/:1-567(+)